MCPMTYLGLYYPQVEGVPQLRNGLLQRQAAGSILKVLARRQPPARQDPARAGIFPTARLLRRFLPIIWTALFALFLGSASFGADYYFSDCATGGQGTKASPWCLDPNSDGKRESLMYLFDGNAPEAAPGDNIFLCAGDCDGSGTATYRPSRTGSGSYWFCSTISGTPSSPITIQNYPGETVIISGDNADGGGSLGHYDGTSDLDSLITNSCSTNITNITWKGYDVPGNGQERNRGLILEKSGARMVTLDSADVVSGYYVGGPTGWVFDGLVFRYSGQLMWSDHPTLPISFYASTCTNNVNQTAMKTEGLTGTFTVRNSVFHSICGFAHRNTNNDAGGGSFLFENNEYYNLGQVNADFYNIRTGDPSHYTSFIWRGNYVHDVDGGIVPKDRTRSVVIEDNTFACLGQYQLTSDGRCSYAIDIDESTSGSYTGTTFDIIIRRNKVYSVATNPSFSSTSCPGSGCGWFLAAIAWRTSCDPSKGYCTNSGGLIENNMVWNHKTPTGGDCEKGGICVQSNNDDIIVRNNTVYGGVRGITLLGSGRNYPVYSNLVASTSEENLWASSGYSSGSAILQNNLYKSSGTVGNINGATFACSGIGGLGSNNKCAAPTFVNPSAPSVGQNDYHLSPSDSNDRGAGAPGCSDDIDKQARTGQIDIGADQVSSSSDTTPPATVNNLRFL
jgi:hypothetical protein